MNPTGNKHWWPGALGIVVVAGILAGWLHQQKRGEALPATNAGPPVSSAPSSVAESAAVSSPDALSQPDNQSARARTLDLVRAKLKQLPAAQSRDESTRLMRELLALVNDQNVVEIAQSLSADELATPFGTALLERWLNLDAVAAADWMANQPDTTGAQAHTIAHRLLADRESFESYCERLPAGEWRENFIAAAGFEIAADDPRRALVIASRLNTGDIQTGLMQSAAFEWARQNPPAAKDWAMQTEDPALREQLIASAAKGYANTDPGAAADWLVASVKSETLLTETAVGIVRSWAASDPVAAADWVRQFPEGSTRGQALDNLISHWSSSDSKAATDWVQKLPEGTLRNEASQILARTTSEELANHPPK